MARCWVFTTLLWVGLLCTGAGRTVGREEANLSFLFFYYIFLEALLDGSFGCKEFKVVRLFTSFLPISPCLSSGLSLTMDFYLFQPWQCHHQGGWLNGGSHQEQCPLGVFKPPQASSGAAEQPKLPIGNHFRHHKKVEPVHCR